MAWTNKVLIILIIASFIFQSISMAVQLRKVVIGHVTCSGRNHARKSGENHYSFSIPFWFALRHHFLWKKMKPYLMLVGHRLCHYFYKKDQKISRCQIDFLIICNFFWSNHFLIIVILLQLYLITHAPK